MNCYDYSIFLNIVSIIFFREERVEPHKTKGGGNTVFVSGHKISEDFLRKHLGQFGTIVNISMEIEKHR